MGVQHLKLHRAWHSLDALLSWYLLFDHSGFCNSLDHNGWPSHNPTTLRNWQSVSSHLINEHIPRRLGESILKTKEKVWMWMMELVQVLPNQIPDPENPDLLDVIQRLCINQLLGQGRCRETHEGKNWPFIQTPTLQRKACGLSQVHGKVLM